MKKYLGIGLVVVTVGFLTGCGASNSLKCTQTLSESDDMTMKQTVNFNFKGDNISTMEVVQTIQVSDEYKSYLSEFEEELASELADMDELKGISYNSKTKGNTITMTISADFAKMDDEAKEELDLVDADANRDAVKKVFEEQGYTCK